MKREIKFRAWDLDNHMMYYQDRDHDNGEGPIMWWCRGGEIFFEENTLIDTCPGGMGHEQHEEYLRPNQVVMQFTGLKDKNGKEIYEGDILNIHIFTQELGPNLGVREGEKEFKAEICYQEMGLWLQGNTEEESGYILWFDGLHEESFEIIGNIHENPELLN